MKIRYVKCSQNGSAVSSACHWQEIKVIDFVGRNVAIGLQVTSSEPFSSTSSPPSIITDGDLHENNPNIFTTITNSSKTTQWVKLDLGSLIDIASLNVWHYFSDDRVTKGVKFEVSSDNTNWTTVFDSSIEGEYQETIDGKCIYFESSLDDNTELYLELNDFSDSSNYKRATTNNNAIIDNNGKFGKCAKMSNSRINVSNFKTKQNKITIDFWIKLNNYNDYPTPFSLYKNSSAARGIYSHVTSGNISLVTPGGTVNKSTGSSVPLNIWTHLAYVVDGTIGRIYVNGKKVGQGTVSSMDFDSVVVGCLYNGNNAFSANINGYIDEFRISSVARYHDDFEVPTKPYSGLALPVNSSLKDTVKAVGDIKNELSALKCNLKSNLEDIGVEVSEEDRMSSLIDKVGDIEVEILPAWTSIGMYIPGTSAPITGRVSSCSVKGDIYIMSLNKIYIYNTNTNSWTSEDSLQQISSSHNSSFVNNSIYCIGKGENYRYDILTKTWTTETAPPVSDSSTGSHVYDSNIYVFMYNTSNSFNSYDLKSKTWSVRQKIPHSYIKSITSTIFNDGIFVIGGSSGKSTTGSNVRYDISSNTWTSKAGTTSVCALGSDVIDSNIYIFGGATHGYLDSLYNSITAQYYNISNDAWTGIRAIGSRPEAFYLSVHAHNKNIYCLCGSYNVSSDSYNKNTNVCYTVSLNN